MSDLEKALEHITENVRKYRATGVDDGEALVGILQQLTATLFYLEKERAEYQTKFQETINLFIVEGNSVARSEKQAHKQVPEMYMLRHIMTSAYEVVGALRTQISWLKSERNS